MKLHNTSPDIIALQQQKNHLEQAGVGCDILYENLMQLAGELRFAHCWPQLVILNEDDFERAQRLIENKDIYEMKGEDWLCTCGEKHACQFTECWSCGAGVS